jgi:hypothetical protein
MKLRIVTLVAAAMAIGAPAASLLGGIGPAAAQTQDQAVSKLIVGMQQIENSDSTKLSELYEGVALDGTLDAAERSQLLSMVKGEDATAMASFHEFEAGVAEEKTLASDHPGAAKIVNKSIGSATSIIELNAAMSSRLNGAQQDLDTKLNGLSKDATPAEMLQMQQAVSKFTMLAQFSSTMEQQISEATKGIIQKMG